MKRRIVAMVMSFSVVLSFSSPVSAFDWDYSGVKYDLSAEAVLGSAQDFERWAAEPKAYLTEKFNNAIAVDPRIEKIDGPVARDGYSLTNVEMVFPGIDKTGDDVRLVVVIARPSNPRQLPTVVTMNGHGEVRGEGHGQAPVTLFADGGYGDRLARSGFTVVAIPDAIHRPFSELAKTTDYAVIWARLADKALTEIKPMLPKDQKFISLGNAVGGLVSLVLTIMRDDIIAIANNGAFFSLEQTRREYRIYTHPFCHDFRAFFTYSAVYALLAPKPMLIQQGKTDSLWLGAPQPPANKYYSGTGRGAISDETIGAYLQLKQIWDRAGALISLDLHDGGHEEFDVPAFEAFVSQVEQGLAR